MQFPNSVFAQALTTNPRRLSSGAQMIAYYGNIALANIGFDYAANQNDAGTVVNFAKSSDPWFTVQCQDYGGCPSLQNQRIQIPANAAWGSYPAPNCGGCPSHGGFDAHMSVISADGGTEYDFWQADTFDPNASTFKPSQGVAIPISHSNGFFPLDGSWQGSATASDRALTAGVPMPQDFLSGTMAHALTLAPPCVNGNSVFPAPSRAGDICPGNQGLPNGARVYLAMSDAAIQALSINQAAKIIYTAFAHYGAYITDVSGDSNWYLGGTFSALTWKLAGQPDPWPAVGAALGLPYSYGRYDLDLSFPPGLQNHLVVVDPCVTQQTC
ncbi:MAG: hypothetical protein ACREM6_05235 [Vulcanimicrobiaceae bacterium]